MIWVSLNNHGLEYIRFPWIVDLSCQEMGEIGCMYLQSMELNELYGMEFLL